MFEFEVLRFARNIWCSYVIDSWRECYLLSTFFDKSHVWNFTCWEFQLLAKLDTIWKCKAANKNLYSEKLNILHMYIFFLVNPTQSYQQLLANILWRSKQHYLDLDSLAKFWTFCWWVNVKKYGKVWMDHIVNSFFRYWYASTRATLWKEFCWQW